METKANGIEYEDLLPVMADKLDVDTFVSELCAGFKLLMDRNSGLITSESLRKNCALLGMEGMMKEEAEAMVREGDLDGDGALGETACMVSFPRVSPLRRYLMENQTQKKIYFHYNHTDSCKFSRWTAKECYQFMYDRPWQQVRDFYWNVVNGFMKVSDLFQTETQCIDHDNETIETSGKSELVSGTTEDRTGRWERVTFKIVLSYHGGSFDGWQKQPCLNTIQGSVEGSLGKFVDERKAQQLKDKNLPIEGCVVVAGRTDKGVTAIQQVCSFYTWRKDVKAQDIEDSINSAAIGKLRVLSVVKVSRIFHPTFSAKWRRYLYIFPFKEGEDVENSGQSQQKIDRSDFVNHVPQRNEYDNLVEEENITCHVDNDKDGVESEKPTRFTVQRVNQLICQLQGKLLSYKIFARDTKASRNIGPPTECFIFHAQAAEATLPSGSKVMCVELVANRFLRKMVRVLVATSIREAAAGANEDALLKLTDATCRRATAPPAPPDGLCLVDVGYSDFDPRKCLIP